MTRKQSSVSPGTIRDLYPSGESEPSVTLASVPGESQKQIKLNSEIFRLVSDYARQEKIGIDTAVNSALRDWFGASV
jgi:hypothetical protein